MLGGRADAVGHIGAVPAARLVSVDVGRVPVLLYLCRVRSRRAGGSIFPAPRPAADGVPCASHRRLSATACASRAATYRFTPRGWVALSASRRREALAALERGLDGVWQMRYGRRKRAISRSPLSAADVPWVCPAVRVLICVVGASAAPTAPCCAGCSRRSCSSAQREPHGLTPRTRARCAVSCGCALP